MANGMADDSGDGPPDPLGGPDDKSAGVRSDDHSAVLCGDDHSGDGIDPAHPASQDPWLISELAALIEPFVGDVSIRTAAKLIARFGSIRNVMYASAEQLNEVTNSVHGLGEKVIAARIMFETALREEVARTTTLPDDPVVARYLRSRLSRYGDERIWVIFLDANNGYITDECVGEGERGYTRVRERHLFQRAFDLQAHGMLLAHNHPSGSPMPSDADIAITRHIVTMAGRLGIDVLDHLIIAGSHVMSMRKGNFL